MEVWRWYVFILWLGSCGAHFYYEENYTIHNLTADLQNYTISKHQENISSQCGIFMTDYVNALRIEDLWAKKVRTIFPSWSIYVQKVDLGHVDEPLEVEKSRERKYCLNTIHFPELHMKNKLLMATFIPEACSTTEIEFMYKGIGFNRIIYEEPCRSRTTKPKLTYGDITIILLIVTLFLIVMVSSIYDFFNLQCARELVHKLLMSFSVLKNGTELLSLKKETTIQCIDGIRVIMMFGIMIFHSYSIRYRVIYDRTQKDTTTAFPINGDGLPDTFLFITGLLNSYYCKPAAVRRIKMNVLMYYLHRYLRFTPLLAVLVLFHLTALKHFGTGPLWPNIIHSKLIETCKTDWWKTLLHIQNYDYRYPKCIPQSWYLAIDMQLTLLFPAISFVMNRSLKLAVLITGFLTICSAGYTFAVAWYFNMKITLEENLFSDSRKNYAYYHYYALLTRMGPWLIGIIFGCIFLKRENKTTVINISKRTNLLLWALSLMTISYFMFSGQQLISMSERLKNSLHLALKGPLWVIASGWIIISCYAGNAAPVNWFLSLPIFRILSRMTFSIYMIHFTVLYIVVAQIRTPSITSNFQEVCYLGSDLMFSFTVALCGVLTIEMPCAAACKVLLSTIKYKK